MMMSTEINSAWDELRGKVNRCTKCPLHETRHNTVFGEGPVNCRCVIIGEGPGEQEDEEGRPFVGPAGQLLTSILEKGGGIPRDSVYIMNVVKCHPPDPKKTNRPPNDDEMEACNDFLEAQLALLHPDIVVTLGNVPTQWLLRPSDGITKVDGITKLRGKWQTWRGIKLLPMFHPSYLLRDEAMRHDNRRIEDSPKYLTWQDVKDLKAELDKLQ